MPTAATRSAASIPTGACPCRWATSKPASRSAAPARPVTSSAPTRTELPPEQGPSRPSDEAAAALRTRPCAPTGRGRRSGGHDPDGGPATRNWSGGGTAGLVASRPVSRVLYRGRCHGDDHPSQATGCPAAPAADPRTGQRYLFRPNARLPVRADRVLLFGLAPGRVCRVSPSAPGSPRARLRLCGTCPRLATDGRYPLPCAEELGLSSGSTLAGSEEPTPSSTRSSGRLATGIVDGAAAMPAT